MSASRFGTSPRPALYIITCAACNKKTWNIDIKRTKWLTLNWGSPNVTWYCAKCKDQAGLHQLLL